MTFDPAGWERSTVGAKDVRHLLQGTAGLLDVYLYGIGVPPAVACRVLTLPARLARKTCRTLVRECCGAFELWTRPAIGSDVQNSIQRAAAALLAYISRCDPPPDTPTITTGVAALLQRKSKLHPARGTVLYYDSLNQPAIPIHHYVHRCIHGIGCPAECAIVAFLYLSRACHAGVTITPFNTHRLWAVCTLVAVKFCDDSYRTNQRYASVMGLTLHQLNALERTLLFHTLEFNLAVSRPELRATRSVIANARNT